MVIKNKMPMNKVTEMVIVTEAGGIVSLMSEMEARYCLRLLRDELPDGIGKVLAQPPDLVVLLRWLIEWRDTYADKLTGYVYAPPDMAWATIEVVINEIQETVCLIDEKPGWEWVKNRE